MPTNLLLLPLLGGYWFVHFCYFFRFRSQRLDGYRLLIESAIAGLFLAAAARILVCLITILPGSTLLQSCWERFSPFPFSGSAAGSVILGVVLPWIVNYCYDESRSKDRALESHGNALFKLLHDSVRYTKPIAITLANRKWYMGYVTVSPNLDPLEQYFNLIPVMSGYRDSDSLEVKRTVFYENAYADGANRNDFAITIPLGSVSMAHLFDENFLQTTFVTHTDGEKS